jgi:hypothetical protein
VDTKLATLLVTGEENYRDEDAASIFGYKMEASYVHHHIPYQNTQHHNPEDYVRSQTILSYYAALD